MPDPAHTATFMAAAVHRSEGRFYTFMGLVAMLIVIAGFAPGFVDPSMRKARITIAAGAHGAIFAAWLVLFLTQTLLITKGQYALHRRLGYFGVALAALMVVSGYFTATAMARRGYDLSGDLVATVDDALEILVFQLGDLLSFSVLVTAAVVYRRRAEVHKRLMLLATVGALMGAPLAHVIGHWPVLRDIEAPIILIPLVMLYFAGAVHDRLSRGRIHPVFLWVPVGLFVWANLRAAVIGPSDAWHQFAAWLIRCAIFHFPAPTSGGLMTHHPTPPGGMCSARFEPLRELFAAKLQSGEDLGASIAVNIDGEMVVDLWGGWADEARTVPWCEDTITCVFSTTKTMTALAALVLVDRGDLDLDAPVAKYWPEFASGGKANVKVRHLLSHTSGVSGWAQPVTLDDVYDWDKSTALLAAQAPWWEPGTASGYHMVNYGHLIGEVVRRITGQRVGEFFAAHVAGPLGADFHIGLPRSEFQRVANVVPPPSYSDVPPLDPNSMAFKTWTNPSAPPEASWTDGWRRADIGAAGGHGNARSVARLQSAVACGGEVDGVRVLSPQTIQRVFETQSDGIDLVIAIPFKFGVGYSLLSEGRVCAWGGAGGSCVIIDVDRRITFAYVMNKMAPGGGAIAAALAERLSDIVTR